MKRILFVFVVVLGVCCTVWAQSVNISPCPQSVKCGAVLYSNNTPLYIYKEKKVDKDALRILKNSGVNLSGTKKDVRLVIGKVGDAAVRSYKSKVPVQAEGYYLEVGEKKIVIAGRDDAGVFYGVQTFLQLMRNKDIPEVTIVDYPSTKLRGVIEGFYGNPWSEADRISQFEFYGQNKMNIYVYGPKDDPYHRPKWREPYPEAEGKGIRHLVENAKANKVKFVWAIHPGVDIKWNLTDSINIVNKLESVYELGVRSFAVFFDDIWGEGANAEKQAGLLNYITDNFVRKHHDVEPLIMCPTEYNRGWAGKTYLPTLGTKMYKEIRIMWTGNTVVDMINKSDMDWINERIQRPAFIWLNYPVNDFCINHLLMGKTYGNDLNIADQVSAFCTNPMEYAEASKVSIFSIADYAWNMPAYDAVKSWYRAMETIMPTAKDAFRVFCEHNIDLGANTHNMRRENESERFALVQRQFEEIMEKGYDEKVMKLMEAQFDTMIWAVNTLFQDEPNHPAMIEEITPWLKVMAYVGIRGKIMLQLHRDLQEKQPQAFLEHYREFLASQQEEDGIMSRDFPGSIKAAHPIVANEVVVPFIKNQVFDLIARYKKEYKEGHDLFPSQAVENGIYMIRYNGKFLTDEFASPTRTGDYPVWKAELDTINPQRQQWTIQLNATTGRYKISNTQDSRYVNEYGTFWKSTANNPYDQEWHTFTVYRKTLSDGQVRYAIQNGGAAGTDFWTVNEERIVKGSNKAAVTDADYIFELVPVK